jgi:hypothetical protein
MVKVPRAARGIAGTLGRFRELPDIVGGEAIYRDTARFHGLGYLADQFDPEQAVIEASAADLNIVGEIELALRVGWKCRDTLCRTCRLGPGRRLGKLVRLKHLLHHCRIMLVPRASDRAPQPAGAGLRPGMRCPPSESQITLPLTGGIGSRASPKLVTICS